MTHESDTQVLWYDQQGHMVKMYFFYNICCSIRQMEVKEVKSNDLTLFVCSSRHRLKLKN